MSNLIMMGRNSRNPRVMRPSHQDVAGDAVAVAVPTVGETQRCAGRFLHEPSSWATADARLPLRRSNIRIYEIDGEAVLFDPITRGILLLNQTALAVFRWCNGRATKRQIAESLAGTYDLDVDSALDHVNGFITLLGESELMEGMGAN